MAKEYGNNSIRRQDDREACRKRLPTYFGTTELAGAMQSIKEILSNAIDEEKVKDKKGKVKLTIHKDNSITVEDEGRGLPLDWNKNENCYNAELMLSTLHAGGKFDDNRGDNFVDSAGMNGLGLTVTALSSKWIKVESRRDGYIYNIEMKEGYYSKDNDVAKSLKKEKDPKGKNQKTGTIISWKCDTDEVYLDDNFDLEEIKSWVDMQARLADGVVIELKDERVDFKQDFCYKDGLRTYMESQVEDPKSIVEFEFKGTGKDSAKQKSSYEVRGRVLFAFTDGKKTDSMWYHNSLPMTLGGSPKNAEQNAFLNFFSKRCKGVKKLEFSDIQENLIFYSNTLTQIAPAFKNQTKDALGMPFIEQCLQGNIEKNLEKWAKDNPLELDKMTQQIEANNQARLTSASVKQLTKEKLSGKIKLSDKILKLTECDSDDVNITEVYFCEGDSASSIKDARDAKFQAIYAMRGKPKNVMKMNLGKILEHQVLTDILKVIGTGVQLGGKKNQIGDYDFTKRKFGKYIIASDADSDGDHIACLMLTIFYTLMPELLEKGCVYRLLTPLFVNELKDGSVKEAYTDKDQDEILKKFGDKIKKTSRYKGLGEWRSEDVEPYIDPNKNRKLVQYTIEDAEKAKETIEMWMAGDAEVRRAFINEHGDEYKDLDFSGGSE